MARSSSNLLVGCALLLLVTIVYGTSLSSTDFTGLCSYTYDTSVITDAMLGLCRCAVSVRLSVRHVRVYCYIETSQHILKLL